MLGLVGEHGVVVHIHVQGPGLAVRRGHAEVHHHAPRQTGRLAEVRGAAGGDIFGPEDQLLGGFAAHEHLKPRLQLEEALGVLFALGDTPSDAQGIPSGHDRGLVHGVRAGAADGHKRVPALVEGREALLVVAHGVRPLQPDHHAVEGLLQVLHRHVAEVFGGGAHGGDVEDVEEVGAGHARGAASERLELDVVRELELARIQLEDLGAALEVGHRDDHLLVQAPGAGERFVQRLGEVRRADDHDAVVLLEAVELHEELI
mmetsp:Transcript_76507/g.221100  ORF Transcript_76507/g.221100 Transcript_76507/m.221100 type:complete len:260 (+) Transcript_76507:201-980(+)